MRAAQPEFDALRNPTRVYTDFDFVCDAYGCTPEERKTMERIFLTEPGPWGDAFKALSAELRAGGA